MKIEEIVIEKIESELLNACSNVQVFYNHGHQYEEQVSDDADVKTKELQLMMYKKAVDISKNLGIAIDAIRALKELYNRDLK